LAAWWKAPVAGPVNGPSILPPGVVAFMVARLIGRPVHVKVTAMAKIKVANPVAELDGDEMDHVELYKEQTDPALSRY
jgi:hypothetical protein